MGLYINNISKSFERHRVLQGVNIDIEQNGIYAIVGRSGAGKSTLVNILSGLETITDGSIRLERHGKDLTILERRYMSAIVYQESHLIMGLTVRENIEIAMELCGQDLKKFDLNNVLEELGLTEYIDKKVQFLSGGEKQRVAIARAYCSNKDIIIADEPTGNLDDENAVIVFDLLTKIAKDKIVLVVSHDMEMVEKYANTIYFLENGKVVDCKNNIISDNLPSSNKANFSKPNISEKSYFKLLKHLLHKKSWIYAITSTLSVVIMIIISVLMTFNGINYEKMLIGNIKKGNSGLISITTNENHGNWGIDSFFINTGIKTYNKGFNIISEYEVLIDKSNIEDNMYYYLFENQFINNAIELSEHSKPVLVLGNYPKNQKEVLIPEYWVEQCLHFSVPLAGHNISNISDIINKEIDFFGDNIKIVGVHKSDMYYPKLLEKYKVKHINYDGKSEKIEEIIANAKFAPSLTTFYFGEGFREEFIAKHYVKFNDIVMPSSLGGYESIYCMDEGYKDTPINLYSENLDNYSPSVGEVVAPVGFDKNKSSVTIVTNRQKNTFRVAMGRSSERGFIINKKDFESMIGYNVEEMYNAIQLNATTFDKIYERLDNSKHIASDNSGLMQKFINDFENNLIFVKAFLGILITFLVVLKVLIVSLQKKDNQKDIAIMMSFGGKVPFYVSLFGVVNLALLILESVIASTLFIGVILIINNLIGLQFINAFVWGALDILLPVIISFGVLAFAIIGVSIYFSKQKIINNLNK